MLALVADTRWPTTLDALVACGFASSVIIVVTLGYVFMVLDFRAYLRSLRRALVRVVNYLPEIPAWTRIETPHSISALGLRMPCTEADVLGAYRQRVKRLHPDRGGDKRRFLALQHNFEEALRFLADYDRAANP